MGYNRYDRGDWDAICDVCGRKFKASTLRKRWDNLMVCSYDFEMRQPQDFVRAIVDKQTVPWSRPESSDTFVGTGITTENNIQIYLESGMPLNA
jgi:hypothetical protein